MTAPLFFDEHKIGNGTTSYVSCEFLYLIPKPDTLVHYVSEVVAAVIVMHAANIHSSKAKIWLYG